MGKFKTKTEKKVGDSVHVDARTLTGYEEGLYAWLTVQKHEERDNFGIAEMGGASSQVTFPCSKCDVSDDARKVVMVNGKPLPIYSYSFLGLGQDEALIALTSKTIPPANCVYGIGKNNPAWKREYCAEQIPLSDMQGIRDPYNMNGKQQGTYRNIPTQLADVTDWFLTGAFNYMDNSGIDTCCVNKGQCFNEAVSSGHFNDMDGSGIDTCCVNKKCFNKAVSCFRAVYLEKYLQTLKNIPKTSEKMDVSWTLGAAICYTEKCLQKATPPPICRWSDKGCL